MSLLLRDQQANKQLYKGIKSAEETGGHSDMHLCEQCVCFVHLFFSMCVAFCVFCCFFVCFFVCVRVCVCVSLSVMFCLILCLCVSMEN